MSASGVRAADLRAFGVRTPVIEAGPEQESEAVIFIHGNPGSRLDWVDLVGRAGELARAVAFDLPGFGQAEKPRGFPYNVPGYARFIGQTLERLGVERAHLVLHDFGGPFGLAWAASSPDAFASVVIVNAPTVSGYRWYPLAKVWRTPVAGELLHATLVGPTFRFLVRLGNPRGLPDAFVQRMWRDYDRGTRRAVLELYRATDARRMVAAPPSYFRALGRPALVVWGRRDIYIPARFAERHRQAFPDSEIIYFDDSGHFPMVDNPEGVAEAVLPFLRKHVGSAR